METSGLNCVKYLLFLFNFFFALCGLGFIVTGAFILKDIANFGDFVGSGSMAPAIILICLGVIVFAIAFFGCCGAIKESAGMLITFASLLIIVFVIEIAVVIVAAVIQQGSKDEMKQTLVDAKNNFDAMNENDRKMWAYMQSELKCCGVDGPDDWKRGASNYGSYYPESCCEGSTKKSVDGLCGPSKEHVYKDGCFEKLKMRLKDGSMLLLGVGIGIAAVQIIGIVLAFVLADAIKKEEEEE